MGFFLLILYSMKAKMLFIDFFFFVHFLFYKFNFTGSAINNFQIVIGDRVFLSLQNFCLHILLASPEYSGFA